MKMIRHLRKSLVKEFGNEQILKFLNANIKVQIQSPIIQQYYMQLDKPRLAARYSPEHQLLHALLGERLDSYLLPLFPSELTSYQKGKKLSDVFKDLNSFLNHYKKNNPVKSKRHLGVLKFDIKNYGDSIPLHENSQLWKQLSLVGLNEIIPVLKIELRAQVEDPMHSQIKNSLIRGLSFGLPTTPPLMNLYLTDFDRMMVSNFPAIFYRRFGDDGLIVTDDPDQLTQITTLMNETLAELELQAHPIKTKSFNWNQSGFKAQARIEFVGRSVDFSGHIFITRSKQKKIIQHWKNLIWKIKSIDEAYLVPTWDSFIKSAHCQELYIWSNDSDAIKNLSDRLKQITFKYFDIQKNPDYVDLYTKWHHK